MGNQKKNVYRGRIYSIISAVHNVEPYLNIFFKSITSQTLNFNNHIQLIMVDDGSTDASVKIIKKWQAKYPENITYLHKINGGQASARNLGLAYVKTPWVTFIDPDDFVKKNYFEEVDKCIRTNDNLALVSCKIEYYFEKYRVYVNRHPLRDCFKNNEKLYIIKEMKKNIQLSASTAFFRTDLIENISLRFNTNIKPNFEDAHFVNSYFIAHGEMSVYFLSSTVYYYRRRSTKNSTIDTAWSKKALFDDVLRLGCLDLFEQSKKKYGDIPLYLQRTVLYHLAWYYRNLMNHDEKTDFLTQKEKNDFHNLLHKIFEDIDLETIDTFDFANIGFFEKYAWPILYKNSSLPYKILFVQKQKETLKLHYFAQTKESLKIKIDNALMKIDPILGKEHSFVNQPFICEYTMTLPIPKQAKMIFVQIANSPTYIQTATKKTLEAISIEDIPTGRLKQIKILFHNISRKLLLG